MDDLRQFHEPRDEPYACPNCGGREGLWEKSKGFAGVDLNYAWCETPGCGWTGRMYETQLTGRVRLARQQAAMGKQQT